MDPEPSDNSSSHLTSGDQHDDKTGLDRLVFFSDAVFAIAITLLVLDIRLPAGFEYRDNAQLFASLVESWQKHLAYLISFLVIGMVWSSHHRKFRYIKRYDRTLITLNILLLMVVAYIPFPSSLLSENANRTATIFYALTIMLIGLIMVGLWWYATWKNRLINPDMSPFEKRIEILNPILTVIVFALSIGIAIIDPSLARLSWLLLLPVILFVSHRLAERTQLFYKN